MASRERDSSDVPFLAPVRTGKTERPKEPWKGAFVKSIVYGGMDAIVTSFSLISSISAGRLSSVDVLVLGFANLVADGISMGFGDFVSTSTEKDVAARERSVTQWDVENQRRHQQQQLVQKYQALGMSPPDAALVVSIFAKYPETLVDEKMAAEKGMLSPDGTEQPWKNGVVTFASFLVFGCAPILSFIVLIPFTDSVHVKFIGACVLSALALAVLGIAKAKISGESCLLSVGMTLCNGVVAGAAAYGIGWSLRNLAGLHE